MNQIKRLLKYTITLNINTLISKKKSVVHKYELKEL